MWDAERRRLFKQAAACVAYGLCGSNALVAPSHAQTTLGKTPSPERDNWLDRWLETRRLGPPLHVHKFPERVYALLVPISWSPEPAQAQYKSVEVPMGFVTDFASVPRVFWTLLPPDGAYTYAAVIHDYLYWDQPTSVSRAAADDVLKFAMVELRVPQATVDAIYTAVGSASV